MVSSAILAHPLRYALKMLSLMLVSRQSIWSMVAWVLPAALK